jgi:hypothetical protein
MNLYLKFIKVNKIRNDIGIIFDDIGEKLHEKFDLKPSSAVSIIGNTVELKENQYGKFNSFLESLVKYVRSTSSCIITDGVLSKDGINMAELIEQKFYENPYSKDLDRIPLISITDISKIDEADKEEFNKNVSLV